MLVHDTQGERLEDMCHNKGVRHHYGTLHTSLHLYWRRQFHSHHWQCLPVAVLETRTHFALWVDQEF